MLRFLSWLKIFSYKGTRGGCCAKRFNLEESNKLWVRRNVGRSSSSALLHLLSVCTVSLLWRLIPQKGGWVFHFISKSLLIFQQPQIILDLRSHFLKWIGRIFYQSLLIAIFSFAIKSGIFLHSTLDFSSFSWINRILCRFKLLSHFPFLPSPSAIFFGQNVNGALKVSKTFSESLMMKESRCCFSQKESKELAVILQALMKTLGDR